MKINIKRLIINIKLFFSFKFRDIIDTIQQSKKIDPDEKEKLKKFIDLENTMETIEKKMPKLSERPPTRQIEDDKLKPILIILIVIVLSVFIYLLFNLKNL